MKTRFILSLVMLLTVLSVKAQEPVETKIFPTNRIIAPHRIEVTSSNIKYIDNQLVTVIKIQMICKCKYKTI